MPSQKFFFNYLTMIGLILLPIILFSFSVIFPSLKAVKAESSFVESTNIDYAFSKSVPDTVELTTDDVELAVIVDSMHVGFKHLINKQSSDTIYFDPDKHLWTIAVLDTSNKPMTANSNLSYITFDNDDVVCDSIEYNIREDNPSDNDKSLIIKWFGVRDRGRILG